MVNAAAGGESGPPLANLQTQELRCEYLTNPIGVDVPSRGSVGTLASSLRGVVQSAFEIQVASTQAMLDAAQADLWDSGKVASSAQKPGGVCGEDARAAGGVCVAGSGVE